MIGFVQGAYPTEVLRGGIASVPQGHIEAAQSFGMHPLRIFYRVTIPEMPPAAFPGISNLWLIATKDTELLAVVGFTELTLAARNGVKMVSELTSEAVQPVRADHRCPCEIRIQLNGNSAGFAAATLSP